MRCPVDLMHENQTLRNLLRSVAGFIGEGAGGLLPRLGWQMADFNDFVNKSETDIAWEGYTQRKKAREANGSTLGAKRPAEDEGGPSTSRSKKTRDNSTGNNAGPSGDPFNGMLMPMQQSPPSLPGYPPVRSQGEANSMFGNNSDLFGANPGSSGAGYSTQSPVNNYANQQNFVPGINLNVDPSITNLSFSPVPPPKTTATPPTGSQQPTPPQQQQQQQSQAQKQQQQPARKMTIQEQMEEEDDPGKTEAYKLIQ